MGEEFLNAQKLKLSQLIPGHEAIVNGRKYTVLEEVLPPLSAPWLAKTIPFPEDGTFLEIGSGCGCLAVEAVLTGKCRAGVACDITPSAVK